MCAVSVTTSKSLSQNLKTPPARRRCHNGFGMGSKPPVRRFGGSYLLPVALGLCVTIGLAALPARAADTENCLSCHRYRSLARVEKKSGLVDSYHVDPDYYDRALGPHARLRCTDCHERSEVDVIPHKPVRPVDCTRTCHLIDPARAEVRFSHENIDRMLESSVHSLAVLGRSNDLLARPLRPGQSKCLLCHDEPVFRRDTRNWLAQVAPVDRCNVCHTGQQAIDTPYAYWHVYARSRPARSHRDLVRSCGLCHSDRRIREAFHLPDSTASYLASFHGKAMQLGSESTAGCLDCHVGTMQNVHMMPKHDDQAAPTNPSQLGNTCRTPACHPTAGVRITSAAVHLDLSASRGIEYLIGLLFILLIVSTFGPSALLVMLELLQVVVGRHDPGHHQRCRLAEQMLASPAGRRALTRFTPHQRVQHWGLVICFTVLVLTGFPIKFADRPWAEWLVHFMGGLSVARHLHRYAGLVLLLGLVYHLVYVAVFAWRQKHEPGRSWWAVGRSLPMVMNAADLRQLFHLLKYLLFLERTRPAADRFSLEEKFEYFGVFWGTVLLGVTGVVMWGNAWFTQHVPGRLLTIAVIVHTFEALLALLHVGVIHMVGVIFSPSVLPMSLAMFTGITPTEEMAEAHAGMLEQAAQEMNLLPTGGTSDE